MRVGNHPFDKGGQGLIGEVAFELIPGTDLPTEATHFELEERSQATEDVVMNRALPAHEEAADVADLLERVVVALDLPLQAADVPEVAKGDLHALFFRGSLWA